MKNTIIVIESLPDMWGHPHSQWTKVMLPDSSPANSMTLRVLSTCPSDLTAWSQTPENQPRRSVAAVPDGTGRAPGAKRGGAPS